MNAHSLPSRLRAREVLAILLLVGLIVGCGESKKWRGEIDSAVKQLTESVDKVALAVPGERYHRLVDAAIGSDKAARDKAIEQVKKLFQIDLGATYEVELFFGGTKDRKPIQADFFFGAAASPITVVMYCASKDTFQPAEVRNVLESPPMNPDVDEKVNAELLAAIRAIPDSSSRPRREGEGPMEYRNSRARAAAADQRGEERAARHLRNALNSFYGDLRAEPALSSLKRDFPFSNPYLVVLIPEKELAANPDLTISANAYKKQSAEEKARKVPKETLGQRWEIKLAREHFEARRPAIPCGKPPTNVLYAMHNMTELPGVTPEVLSAVAATRNVIAEWEKTNATK